MRRNRKICNKMWSGSMDCPVPNIYSIRREVPEVGHSVVIKEEADTLPQTDERIADAVPKYNFCQDSNTSYI